MNKWDAKYPLEPFPPHGQNEQGLSTAWFGSSLGNLAAWDFSGTGNAFWIGGKEVLANTILVREKRRQGQKCPTVACLASAALVPDPLGPRHEGKWEMDPSNMHSLLPFVTAWTFKQKRTQCAWHCPPCLCPPPSPSSWPLCFCLSHQENRKKGSPLSLSINSSKYPLHWVSILLTKIYLWKVYFFLGKALAKKSYMDSNSSTCSLILQLLFHKQPHNQSKPWDSQHFPVEPFPLLVWWYNRQICPTTPLLLKIKDYEL